jgi:hypothetical protein
MPIRGQCVSPLPNGVDDCGRREVGESRPVDGHVGEDAKVFEEICEAGEGFRGCWLPRLQLGTIMSKIGLELWDSRGLQHVHHLLGWKITPTG